MTIRKTDLNIIDRKCKSISYRCLSIRLSFRIRLNTDNFRKLHSRARTFHSRNIYPPGTKGLFFVSTTMRRGDSERFPLFGSLVHACDAFVLVEYLRPHCASSSAVQLPRRQDASSGGDHAAFVLSRAHVNIHSSAASIPRTLQLHSPTPRLSLTQFDCFFPPLPGFTTVL